MEPESPFDSTYTTNTRSPQPKCKRQFGDLHNEFDFELKPEHRVNSFEITPFGFDSQSPLKPQNHSSVRQRKLTLGNLTINTLNNKKVSDGRSRLYSGEGPKSFFTQNISMGKYHIVEDLDVACMFYMSLYMINREQIRT